MGDEETMRKAFSAISMVQELLSGIGEGLSGNSSSAVNDNTFNPLYG